MENASIMVDSILNALWWPWSRNSNSNTNQPSPTTTSSISSSSTSTTTTIASTTTSDLIVNNDLQISSSIPAPSTSSYYIPFGSLFNPFVANDTSVSTTASNYTEFFTTINKFTSNSSLLSYSNYSTIRPLINFSTNDIDDSSGGTSGENLDYYYNFGENATSINHSYIFATTRANDTNGKILLDSAEGESTIYLIQIVVTAIILGIVILATVIGK